MHEMERCIHGFHVNCAVWTPYIGEHLDCACKNGKGQGPFTVQF